VGVIAGCARLESSLKLTVIRGFEGMQRGKKGVIQQQSITI
jgi:hypothetical protein